MTRACREKADAPKNPRRAIVLAALLVVLLAPRPARSQAPYPSQGIRLIVPYAAGGVPDTVARFVGQRLQERVGQSVVVENRPGGNGSVAAAAIRRSASRRLHPAGDRQRHAVGQSAVLQAARL